MFHLFLSMMTKLVLKNKLTEIFMERVASHDNALHWRHNDVIQMYFGTPFRPRPTHSLNSEWDSVFYVIYWGHWLLDVQLRQVMHKRSVNLKVLFELLMIVSVLSKIVHITYFTSISFRGFSTRNCEIIIFLAVFRLELGRFST